MHEEFGNACSDEISRPLGAGGRLRPGPFLIMAGAVYLLGLTGQMLTAPMVLARLGLWPFLFMQIALISIWFVLHARRLRDAGRGSAPALGLAAIHVLAVVLLVLVGAFYTEIAPGEGWMPESLLLVHDLFAFSHAADPLGILGLVACVALLIPPAFSLWAAAQPGSPA